MMLRYDDNFVKTWTFEHDRLSRELEASTETKTAVWFGRLDRWHARRKGMVKAIDWLRDAQHLSHHLASTLAWNYFNPSTLPDEIAGSIDKKYESVALKTRHADGLRRRHPAQRTSQGRARLAARDVRRTARTTRTKKK